ncbi:MAG: hypothetical protein V4629_13040 [Pseudomonadota bacterium]
MGGSCEAVSADVKSYGCGTEVNSCAKTSSTEDTNDFNDLVDDPVTPPPVGYPPVAGPAPGAGGTPGAGTGGVTTGLPGLIFNQYLPDNYDGASADIQAGGFEAMYIVSDASLANFGNRADPMLALAEAGSDASKLTHSMAGVEAPHTRGVQQQFAGGEAVYTTTRSSAGEVHLLFLSENSPGSLSNSPEVANFFNTMKSTSWDSIPTVTARNNFA